MMSTPPPCRMGSSLIRRHSSNDEGHQLLPLHVADLSSSLSPTSPRTCEISLCTSSSSSSFSPSSSSSSFYLQHPHRRPSPTMWASDTEYCNNNKASSVSSSPTKTTRRRNTSSTANSIGAFFLGGIFFSAIWIGCYYVIHSFLQVHDEALRQSFVANQVIPLTKDMEKKVTYLEKDNLLLQDKLLGLENERAALLLQQQQHQHTTTGDAILLQQQIAQLDQQSVHFMQSIHKLSKYALLERFGNGPHYVEMQLAFDPKSELYQNHHHDTNSNNNKILLQLAKPDEMPHAVFWFLEQVTRRLYDGTSIHRSAAHVLQGGPHTNFLTPAEFLEHDTINPLQERFERSGFDQVLLPGEYHDNWTHEKYTLGYAGGTGPDFYFNMLDNAHIHGPAPQKQDDSIDVEPCFAKVIAGFDLVDAIHASPTEPGPYHALQHNVAIVSMRLLKPNEISPSLVQQQ